MRVTKWRRGHVAIVAVTIMAATVTACSKTPEPVAKPQYVAAFIGDSYTAPATGPAYWQTTAQRMCWEAVPFGVAGSGYTIGGPDNAGGPYVTRVDAVAAAMPSVVIVQGSFNDREPDLTTAAAGILFRSLHERLPGARIFVMGPVTPPFAGAGPQVSRISNAVRTAAESNFAVFIDAEHFLDDPALFGPDDLHPNARGQQVLGGRLAAAMPAEMSSCR